MIDTTLTPVFRYKKCQHVGRALIAYITTNRTGAAREMEHCRASLELMGVHCTVLKNPCVRKITEAMNRMTMMPSWDKYSTATLCICGHGFMKNDRQFVVLDDGHISINNLLYLWCHPGCTNLKGKPKYVFIQACRLGGVSITEPKLETDALSASPLVPLSLDLCIVYVSEPDKHAFRGIFWAQFYAYMSTEKCTQFTFLQAIAQTNAALISQNVNYTTQVTCTLRDVSTIFRKCTRPSRK